MVRSVLNESATSTGITDDQAAAITANSAKVGISVAEKNNITTNTAKVGITATEKANIVTNTAKVGVNAVLLANVTTNNAKVGITASEKADIVTNTAKESISSAEKTQITTNQTSISTIHTDMPHLSTFPTWETLFDFDGGSRKFQPKHVNGDANNLHLQAYLAAGHNVNSTPQVTRLKAGKVGATQIYEVLFRGAVMPRVISQLGHGDILFILPTGYRPSTWRRFPIGSSVDDSSCLDFKANGQVQLIAVQKGVANNNVTVVSLEGIRFYTA